MKPGKSYYFIRFTVFTFILWTANILLLRWFDIETHLISRMLAFLWVVFIVFYFFYDKIKIEPGKKFIFRYLLLLGLKFVVITGGAFLFLSPTGDMIKHEVLFYLFNYFTLLLFDIFLKAGDLIKKLDN